MGNSSSETIERLQVGWWKGKVQQRITYVDLFSRAERMSFLLRSVVHRVLDAVLSRYTSYGTVHDPSHQRATKHTTFWKCCTTGDMQQCNTNLRPKCVPCNVCSTLAAQSFSGTKFDTMSTKIFSKERNLTSNPSSNFPVGRNTHDLTQNLDTQLETSESLK